MTVRAHLLVRGRVQGVWYRGAMQAEARRLGVGGWTRNLSDGTVEAELEGEEAAVATLVAWAERGPSGARVDGVVRAVLVPAGVRDGFVIRG